MPNSSQMFKAFATYSGPYFWWFYSELSPIMIPWNLQGVDHIMLSYISGMAGLCLEFVQISVFYVKWWNAIQDKIRKILMVSRWQEFPPIYHTFISRLRKNWSLPDWYSIAVWRVLQIINVKRYISDFNVKTIKIHYSGRWHTYGIYFWSLSLVSEASVKQQESL